MVKRQYWIDRVEKAWKERSVLWLCGVRRVGKTFLCRSLPDIEYFDCELPRVRRLTEDPESFLEELKGRRIVLDEVHRLRNPSELLKIASDHYPSCQVLATGSSTLGASRKFRDTLTGRKRNIWLTPMILPDLADFNHTDLRHRFLRGGLPPFFMAKSVPEADFQEWMDDYWAKDIQELFRVERRDSFQRFVELVLARSGGIFEATAFAAPCEVSRTTVVNYLKLLETTYVAHVVRPFSTHRPTEIVSAPKVYGFDTGFVCYHRGWSTLRQDDIGHLWEHFVLNEIYGRKQTRRVRYWRDKRGHEVDFVLAEPGRSPLALECKWRADRFEPSNLTAFRKQYPQGDNIVVAQDVTRPYTRTFKNLVLRFENLPSLLKRLGE